MALSQAPVPAPGTEETTGVTAPLGFVAGAAAAAIKGADLVAVAAAEGGEGEARLDVAVLFSDRPASAAAVFTTNRVKAAPVVISQLNLRAGKARGIVVNAGNANACTGSQGFKDALLMAKLAADALDVDPSEMLVASTGVIGRALPMEKVRRGIMGACADLGRDGGLVAARAIMTTDTRVKQAVARFHHGGVEHTIGGMAKGSGMIHVNMATMLGFLTTDASVAPADLDAVLRRAVEGTFNMVTVDGDTSTNDMLAILANGAAGGPQLVPGAGLEAFETAVTAVCDDLSRHVARDGEGATRMFTVEVTGAQDLADARAAARTVASSNLVKTAIHGADPNWGRIVAALGRAGCELVLDKLTVTIGDVVVFQSGSGAADLDLEMIRALFEGDEVKVRCDLGLGPGSATAYGCDLSAEYVHINADYTT